MWRCIKSFLAKVRLFLAEWLKTSRRIQEIHAALGEGGLGSSISQTAQEVNASYNTALTVQSLMISQQAMVGAIANEMNALLNTTVAERAWRSQMLEIVTRVEALNMLVGRGTAALIRRHSGNAVEPLAVRAPRPPVPIAKQIAELGKLAPLNIAAWKSTYKAGRAAYNETTEGNLSHDGHLGAGYFRFFVNVHARGRLLDFGCGPLPVPAYLADWPMDQLAGFDPLPPTEPHPFPFAQSLAESIPWDDASFETVVIATSIDHVYLLDRALAEIKRVLTPSGRLLIWTALFPETPAYDPYTAAIDQPDAYHLFHPGRNWFYKLFEEDFDLLERMETVAQAELLAYRLKL